MRSNRGKIDLVRDTRARGLGIGLSYRVLAHDLEDQVAACSSYVSCVKQILKLRIHLEPSLSVGFMADSVWLTHRTHGAWRFSTSPTQRCRALANLYRTPGA
jgi:hypothetical protein